MQVGGAGNVRLAGDRLERKKVKVQHDGSPPCQHEVSKARAEEGRLVWSSQPRRGSQRPVVGQEKVKVHQRDSYPVWQAPAGSWGWLGTGGGVQRVAAGWRENKFSSPPCQHEASSQAREVRRAG